MKLEQSPKHVFLVSQRFFAPVASSVARPVTAQGLRPAISTDAFGKANGMTARQGAARPGAGAAGPSHGWRAAAGLLRHEPGASLSMPELGRRLERLGQALGGAMPPALESLGQTLGEMRALRLDTTANAGLVLAQPGQASAVEQSLLQTLVSASTGPNPLSAEMQKMFAELLSAVQGRPGVSPLGFEPGAFGLPAAPPSPASGGPAPAQLTPAAVYAEKVGRAKCSAPMQTTAAKVGRQVPGQKTAPAPQAPAPDAGAAARQAQAQKLADEGALQSPGPKPPATKKELDDMVIHVTHADDDGAVRIASNPRALEILTPQQKAVLLRKLMAGNTDGTEEQAIKKILLSCKSKDEMDQVVQMAGGWGVIEDELEESADINAVKAHSGQLNQKQDSSVKQAVTMLEQAQSPEEFKKLYDLLGGEKLKHMPPANETDKKELLARLEALGKKHGVPEIGFGMPPEKTAALQKAVHDAICKGDDDAIVKLSDNSEAMKAATPHQKASMIKILQKGWTKDSQDMAISRILGGCSSKAEFDRTVDMAGGRQILDDVDYPEAKANINKTMGGYGRVDCADDKAVAQAHKDTLVPPLVNELTKTRPPSDAELLEILGSPPFTPEDLKNPALAHVAQAMDKLRAEMGKAAHDLQADPMARNRLATINQDRKLAGQPPLDYTSMVTKAYKAANDPSVEQEVQRRIREDGATKDEDKKEIREKVLAERLGPIAKELGITDQDMKTLVTAKMGRVMQEGAGGVKAFSGKIGESLQARLSEVERTAGPNSPEAKTLREALDKMGPATDAWAARLDQTGKAAENIFKVPPSIVEDVVGALSSIGDIVASVVNLIPGVGQAISGAYFGVKAIVAAANGDLGGFFGGLLSCLPGAGALAGAGQAVSTGIKAAQMGYGLGKGIVEGDLGAVLGAVGNIGGGLGVDLGGLGQAGKAAQTAYGLGKGIAGGDLGAVLGAVGGGAKGLGVDLGSLGQAGQAAQTVYGVGKSIAGGNPGAILGAVDGGAKALDVGLGNLGQAGAAAQSVLQAGAAAGGALGAVVRGDVAGMLKPLGDLSSQVGGSQRLAESPSWSAALDQASAGMLAQKATLPGELRAVGMTGIADRLEAFGASPEATAFRHTTERFSQLLGAAGQNQPAAVGEVLRQWTPELANGSASGAIAGLSKHARLLLDARELSEARLSAYHNHRALEVQRSLESVAALGDRAVQMRQFEEATYELASRWQGDWPGMGADLLQSLSRER